MIESLIADRQHLRDQLDTATRWMSRGMTRGWQPNPER